MTNTIDIIIPKINFSGVSNTSQMLANYLRSEGWRVNFITLRGYDEKADILDQKVEFSNLSSNKILTSLWTLLKYMRANQSTPMMIWGKEYTVIGLIFKKILFLKNIIIGVNVNNIRLHIQRSSSLSYFAKNLLYKNTMKHADFWISQSGGIKDEMIADYNVQNNKTSVIYPAIQIPANANETKNRDEIIFVGRLTDQKNPILALRYAIKFLERNPTYFFRILGDGDLMPDMKKLASSSNVNGRIIFEGFVKNTSDYITGTKAMILTSRYEGFGMVIVESIYYTRRYQRIPCYITEQFYR